ncbi:uncharacterized protein HKW66_Vig0099500 [Vigna angularis]|uniref:Uncharacterized protein n=1 Tax=Phaseolus angularis TaxID=3914 RepID=A0A8T0KKF4_PHAAN|nr:uncharacterized protein HKW66_Vig0099500 [Vigna angularis]
MGFPADAVVGKQTREMKVMKRDVDGSNGKLVRRKLGWFAIEDECWLSAILWLVMRKACLLRAFEVFSGFDFLGGHDGKGEDARRSFAIWVWVFFVHIFGAVISMVDDDPWARWSGVIGRGVVVSATAGSGHKGGDTMKEKDFCLENMMLTWQLLWQRW